MDKRGKFVVIDGMDGSGKGTQIKLLQNKLIGSPVVFTREPGGTPKAEEIRETLGSVYLPDLYLVLDLPAEVAFNRRAKDQSQHKSKFDLKPIEYHQRVRDGFRAFARFAPVSFIDANRPPQAIFEDIWREVQAALQ